MHSFLSSYFQFCISLLLFFLQLTSSVLRIPLKRHCSHPLSNKQNSKSINNNNDELKLTPRLIEFDTSALSSILVNDFSQLHSSTSSNSTHKHHKIPILVRLLNYYSVMYTASITIGTPPQNFEIIADTGSSCVWVMSTLLTQKHSYLHYYNPLDSKTYESYNSTKWEITYGVGRVHGQLAQDTVRLSSLQAKNQVFALATHLTSNFANRQQPLDGLIGLSFKGGSCDKWPTFLDSLFIQKQIRRRVFAFFFTSEQVENLNQRPVPDNDDDESDLEEKKSSQTQLLTHSELIIGMPTPEMYKGELTWVDVLHGRKRRKKNLLQDDIMESDNGNQNIDSKSGSDRSSNIRNSAFSQLRSLSSNFHSLNNHNRHKEEQEYYEILPPQMWFVLLESLKIEGHAHLLKNSLHLCVRDDTPCIALPDSGTSFLTLPKRMFVDVINLITAGRSDCLSDRELNIFCLDGPTGLPSLTFYFNEQPFVLRPQDYMLSNRQLAIQTLDFGLQGINVIILGDVFLRTVFTVFDADNWRVGFAMSKHLETETTDYTPGFISNGATLTIGLGTLLLTLLLCCIGCFVCIDCCFIQRARRQGYRELV